MEKKGDALVTIIVITERLRFTFAPNGRREFLPRDQVFPLLSVYSLLLLHKNKYFYSSFILKNLKSGKAGSCILRHVLIGDLY